MIRAVVSDCVGVLTSSLARPFAAFNERWELPPAALGEAIAAIAARRGENPLFELETGRLGEREFLEMIQLELHRALGREIDMTSFSDVYWHNLEPNDELIAFLRPLRETHTLAMLTNNVREWEPRWRAMLPVEELFELVVDSSAVGLRKPDREIFELTVERLGLEPAQCLFIDDLPPNCETAQQLGMRVVHFRETAQAIDELRAALAA